MIQKRSTDGRAETNIHRGIRGPVVLEMITNKISLSKASREFGIKDRLLPRRQQEFLEWAPQVFEQPKAEEN
jgi:hypothetical protein